MSAVVVRGVQWVTAITVVLLFGELWTQTMADSIFFPPPSEVFTAAWNTYVAGPGLGDDVLPSLWRFGRGWGLAVVTGVGAGLMFGLMPLARAMFDPLMQFGRAIPTPLVLGAFLILFGIGDAPKVFLIAFGSVWPVLFNTMDAVSGVHPTTVDTAQAFGRSRLDTIRSVLVPSISPQVMAGLKVSLSIGLILMVLTEFVGAADGLGFALIRAQRSFAFVDMWAALLVLALVGLVLNVGLILIERRALLWHRTERLSNA